MNNPIFSCHEAIRKLNIPVYKMEALLRELAESGFTENLKTKVLTYLGEDVKSLKDRLSEMN